MNESDNENVKFEDALAELERIVRELEDGQTGLEQSLARYEQGVVLLRNCYQQLQQAEQRILALTGQSEEGAPILKPFAHAATAEKESLSGKESGPAKPTRTTSVRADSKSKKDTLPLWTRDGEE
jgi:exodeoxyribonuclease VII small subunit